MANELIDTQVLRKSVRQQRSRVSIAPEFETVWMSRDALVDFFDCNKKEIIAALAIVLKQLDKSQHVRRVHFVKQGEGASRAGYESQYSLSVVLRLALLIENEAAEQVREWMLFNSERLLTKGFVLDKERIQGEARRSAFFEKQCKLKT